MAVDMAYGLVMERRSFQSAKVVQTSGGGADLRVRDRTDGEAVKGAGVLLQGKIRPEDEVMTYTPNGDWSNSVVLGLSPYHTGEVERHVHNA